MKKVYFIILLALISCAKEKKCITEKEYFITNIDAPLEGLVNQQMHIEITMALGDCMSFQKLVITGSEKDKTIVPIIRENTCNYCTTAIQEKLMMYSFIPKEKGIYNLRFKSGENTYIQTQIKVE